MSVNQSEQRRLSTNSTQNLETDVLVIGGGPAGTWAAWNAAASGARVVLVDKGYCGTSGAAAASGNGVWYIPPDPEQRESAMASREAMGGFLANRHWMTRVLDRTYDNINSLADWGYPFRVDNNGVAIRRSLQGPDYMRFMRKKIQQAGVKILDNSPALELLVDAEGTVAGALGINRQSGEQWKVQAGAVVIATGGCAFLSKALGCNVLTGDGLLMAAEVGADFSGMEFSNAYAISPSFSSVTKTRYYDWASFTYEDGTVIEGAGSKRGRSVIAKTLLTQPVYARLDQGVDEETKAWMRASQPNFFVVFDRAGIDPFTQRFPITLRLEGTVRGTGGIRIADYTCATSVTGLYAAGDAATRELICGGFTGGGSHNAAWAMSSGYWSGQSAATYALSLGEKATQRLVRGVGEVGLQSAGNHTLSPEEAISAVQAEVFPYDRNLFRTATGLSASLEKLDDLWQEICNSQIPTDSKVIRTREVAAMVATARWMYNSGLQRQETRGMHKRMDYPQQDPNRQYRLLSGGLDKIWVKPESAVVSKELVAV
ncbi:FAD-dependent oxidoreductase [Scytonema sp. NUACC26]|uniref:FAD-dependent oxidoreductase n=1 Tax=Scytonema sp. NUACC26 TaxID=3140176 RepID=UPI0034DB8B5B